MKFLVMLIPLLMLTSCGKKNKNDKKNIVAINENLTTDQIDNFCGLEADELDVAGPWKQLFVDIEGLNPPTLIDFIFEDNGSVEIGLACKVSEVGVNASYNYKTTRTTFKRRSNKLTINQHNPIILTRTEDGVDCQLKDLSGDYRVEMRGSCLTINLKGQNTYFVRE